MASICNILQEGLFHKDFSGFKERCLTPERVHILPLPKGSLKILK